MYSICEGEPELADTGISTHQVKHPLTSTIHSPFTGELKKFSIKSKCVQMKTCYPTITSPLHHLPHPHRIQIQMASIHWTRIHLCKLRRNKENKHQGILHRSDLSTFHFTESRTKFGHVTMPAVILYSDCIELWFTFTQECLWSRRPPLPSSQISPSNSPYPKHTGSHEDRNCLSLL